MAGRDPIHTQPKSTGRSTASPTRGGLLAQLARIGMDSDGTTPARPLRSSARRDLASLLRTATHQQAKACPLHTARQCTDTG